MVTIEEFPFLDLHRTPGMISEGYRTLHELGAHRRATARLTELGRRLATAAHRSRGIGRILIACGRRRNMR